MRRHRLPLLLTVFTIFVMYLCFAPPARAAGLLIADGGFGGVLEIKEHDVHVTINNGVAVTEVTQVFQQHREPPGRGALHLPRAQGRVRRQLQHVDQRQGDGRRGAGEEARPRDLRQLQADAPRPGPARADRLPHLRDAHLPDRPAGRAEGAGRPTTRSSTSTTTGRPTSTRWPPSTRARRRRRARPGSFAITLDVKSEVPIVAMESPSHADGLRHREARRRVLAGEPGDARRRPRSRTSCSPTTSRGPRPASTSSPRSSSGEDGYFCLTLTAGEELAEQDAGDGLRVRARRLRQHGRRRQAGPVARSRRRRSSTRSAPKDRFEVIAFNVAPTTAVQASCAPPTTQAKQRGGRVPRRRSRRAAARC